jgi:SAM-dependent methyltransferase
MANGVAVLSEANDGETVDPDLASGLAQAPYELLVDAACGLLADDAALARLADAGRAAFAARQADPLLKSALVDAWPGLHLDGAAQPPVPALPRHALIGSGKAYDPTALNIDLNPAFNPDIVADITDPGMFTRDHECSRFGRFRLPAGHFERLTASHVLEHLRDLITAMANCLELLAEGGLFEIAVPYDLSYGAWQDPTHVRAFDERSWWYYCEWYWYLGWTEARFDLVEQDFVVSPLGHGLRDKGIPEEEILRTPRAVDEMRVVLRKRRLTPDEQAHGRAMRGDARA